MALHPSVAQHIPRIRELAEEYGVDKLEIFGSAMTDRFDVEKSDVDFIVHYPKGYEFGHFIDRFFRFEEDLTTILGRNAELVMTSALQHKSFRENANRTRMTVYVGDEFASTSPGNQETMSTHR